MCLSEGALNDEYATRLSSMLHKPHAALAQRESLGKDFLLRCMTAQSFACSGSRILYIRKDGGKILGAREDEKELMSDTRGHCTG